MTDFRLAARGDGDLKARYRPMSFAEIAPTFPVERVQRMVDDPLSSRVLLFVGQSGVGKTTAARVLARASVCASPVNGEPCLECAACKTMEKSPDYREINIADFRKIDDVREFVQGFAYRPLYLRRKVFILDEVHQLTGDAQQVLLKSLEEPPEHLLIVLCTTETKGLKRTLLSRCTEVQFQAASRPLLEAVAEQILEDAADETSIEALQDHIQRADGSVRDFLNHLQAHLDGAYTPAMPEDVVTNDVKELTEALRTKNWPMTAEVLARDTVKRAPEATRLMTMAYLRGMALRQNAVNLSIAFPMGQLGGTLAAEPKAEQYNLLVLRCMRACAGKK